MYKKMHKLANQMLLTMQVWFLHVDASWSANHNTSSQVLHCAFSLFIKRGVIEGTSIHPIVLQTALSIVMMEQQLKRILQIPLRHLTSTQFESNQTLHGSSITPLSIQRFVTNTVTQECILTMYHRKHAHAVPWPNICVFIYMLRNT